MIKVEFFKIGTVIFLFSHTGIKKAMIGDVYIDSKTGDVSYSINDWTGKLILKTTSEFVFESLDSIKSHIDKQILELTPKSIEKGESETDSKVANLDAV